MVETDAREKDALPVGPAVEAIHFVGMASVFVDGCFGGSSVWSAKVLFFLLQIGVMMMAIMRKRAGGVGSLQW